MLPERFTAPTAPLVASMDSMIVVVSLYVNWADESEVGVASTTASWACERARRSRHGQYRPPLSDAPCIAFHDPFEMCFSATISFFTLNEWGQLRGHPGVGCVDVCGGYRQRTENSPQSSARHRQDPIGRRMMCRPRNKDHGTNRKPSAVVGWLAPLLSLRVAFRAVREKSAPR